jgi:uncharacterized protein YbaP (TraB family)
MVVIAKFIACYRGFLIRRALGFAVSLLCANSILAGPLPLWQLEGTSNRVLLMGSVHFLRATDYPLPAGLEAAYETADTLVMEIDMDDLDPLEAQVLMTSMGMIGEGQSLSDVIGANSYATAARLAEELGVPLMLFNQFKPWFAALSITQLRMLQLGFDPAWGIETQFLGRAAANTKEIVGLETLEEQLGFMDRLDADAQRKFLLQSLEDAGEVQNEVQTIVAAWRTGDTGTLHEMLLDGLEETPRLYDMLLTQRNQNWAPQIARLANQPDNYLVIVGAMHLVGENSILRMLEKRGIKSRQLSDEDWQ